MIFNMAGSYQFLSKPFELISSLWDSPPMAQNAIGLLPQATASSGPLGASPTTAPQMETLHSLCGSISFEPGSPPDLVCGVAGLHIPFFVVFSSVAMLGVTVILLVRNLRKSNSFIDEIEVFLKSKVALASRIQQPGLASSFWSRLGERMKENASPEKVASWTGGSQAFVSWNLGRWVQALPGWLTSAGLLITFLAILNGLSKIHVGPDLQVQGIAGLINSLAGKFFSSVVALGLALTVSVFDHWNRLRVADQWARLEDALHQEILHGRKS